MTKRRLLILKIALAGCATVATCLVVEFAYRWSVYRALVAAKYPITTVDARIYDSRTPGYYRPGVKFHWRQFDADHNLLHECQVQVNNRGFISRHDYRLEKPAGEFRVALVGDSLTACITNDVPWGDLLQRELNADDALLERVGATSVKVMNFGAPGAGFHAFARLYREYGAQYSPDLVIVNYIEDDFPREGTADLLGDAPLPTTVMISQQAFAARVQMAEVILAGPISPAKFEQCGDPLQLPEATPSFFFVVEDNAANFDKEAVVSVKREVAQRYLSSRLWRSWHPHVLYRALGAPFSLSYADRMFAAQAYDCDEQASHALAALRDIQSRAPRLIVMRNPLHPDLTGQGKQDYTTRLEEQAGDLKVVRMEKYLPVEKGPDDIHAWFNLPHDGHFSNYGAQLYSQAVHRMLNDYFQMSPNERQRATPMASAAASDSRPRTK